MGLTAGPVPTRVEPATKAGLLELVEATDTLFFGIFACARARIGAGRICEVQVQPHVERFGEYALVSLEARRIEIFRRDATGHWVLHPFALDETLELASLDFRCHVAEIFEGVEGE